MNEEEEMAIDEEGAAVRSSDLDCCTSMETSRPGWGLMGKDSWLRATESLAEQNKQS